MLFILLNSIVICAWIGPVQNQCKHKIIVSGKYIMSVFIDLFLTPSECNENDDVPIGQFAMDLFIM